jgi:hypothetical protein
MRCHVLNPSDGVVDRWTAGVAGSALLDSPFLLVRQADNTDGVKPIRDSRQGPDH